VKVLFSDFKVAPLFFPLFIAIGKKSVMTLWQLAALRKYPMGRTRRLISRKDRSMTLVESNKSEPSFSYVRILQRLNSDHI
jgi:hypothetical protein